MSVNLGPGQQITSQVIYATGHRTRSDFLVVRERWVGCATSRRLCGTVKSYKVKYLLILMLKSIYSAA